MMSLWAFAILKVCNETITNSKHHLIKIKRLHYTDILSKS